MQTKYCRNKIIVTDCSNQERMQLRRLGVNVATKNGVLTLEDNIFNRTLLSLDSCAIFRDICDFRCDVNKKSRNYQTRDIAQSLRLKYVLNVNKPGYGKTFEAIEYCRLKNLKRILIVCPKSVVTQWKSQFETWWPDVATNIQVCGAGPLRQETSIFITNYEQLTFHRVRGNKKELRPSPVWQRCKEWLWDVIILDESHRIKNASSLTTMAIKQLPSVNRMCLTGTPILRRPDDLWSQLNFLDPQLSGGSYWAFVERFCEIDVNNFGKKPIGLTPSASAQELLGNALAQITIGGENHKVTSGKNIIPIDIPMSKAQKDLYRKITNLALEELDAKGITVKNAVDQLMKLQQVASNCGKFDLPNPKFEWIKDWLEDNEGEQLVVYSRFAETIKALQQYLGKDCVAYIGELSTEVRNAAKWSFISGTRVLAGTIGALGTGVDGLQDVCRNVVFIDREWNPGINEQAEQRVDRPTNVWTDKGMTNIWILNAKGSMDSYVGQIADKKAEDIKEVFERVCNSLGPR